MRSSLSALLLVLMLPAIAQADTPDALKARLTQSEASTSLEVPGLKPWHLKAAVQLFDEKGANPQDGTIEEWWAGPNDYRLTYTLAASNGKPGFSGTHLETPGGAFQNGDFDDVPTTLNDLHRAIVHPMAEPNEISGSTPDLRKLYDGKVTLDCIILDQPIMQSIAFPPLGLFPTYCMLPQNKQLRLTLEYASQSTSRNGMGTFQGQSVSTIITVEISGVHRGTAKVSALSTIPATDIDHQTAGLDPVAGKAAQAARLPGGVIKGMRLQGSPPHYPEEAKREHKSGDVVLRALIGRNGHVRKLQVISAPAPSLAIAAMAAVAQWTYTPYILNGRPTEVDTTITVQFRYG